MEMIRLLIVDADDQAFANYKSLSAQQGWVIDRVRMFSEVLNLNGTLSYDVAIIELALPDALGTDVWDHLKNRYSQLVGIMTTQSSSLHKLIDPLSSGATAFLLKPVDQNTLAQIIDRALP